ncbi:MAG: DivIVA domain-containing protein, partial [Actinobacteria bacterium]|nr:DivIVA domain-containing protein [Actinomycetota bacterium]
MAISFSRPDPSSPAAVSAAAFSVARRGYDQAEVRDFLRMVAAELARLQERERFLESELKAMQTRGMSAPGVLDEEVVTTLLGEEAARVLGAAREASTQIRQRAEENATRLVKEAAADAARLREEAELEAVRRRDDAAGDAEAEIELAKQQGREMVNEAREYREKVLSELARRRELARTQIEQLVANRDRLLNAFERARLATDDVMTGLVSVDDDLPREFVNLAPTTGPVAPVTLNAPVVQMFDREKHDLDIGQAEEPSVEPIGDVVIAEDHIEQAASEQTASEQT